MRSRPRIGGVAYLLVSDSLEDEAYSLYFKRRIRQIQIPDACYEMVEDENELQAVYKVFEQMLEDVDLEM